MHLSPFINYCEDCEDRIKKDVNCRSEAQVYCDDCLSRQNHLDQEKVARYKAGFNL